MLHRKSADINANAIKGAVVNDAAFHGAHFTRIEASRTIALHKIFRDGCLFSGDHFNNAVTSILPAPWLSAAEYRCATLSLA